MSSQLSRRDVIKSSFAAGSLLSLKASNEIKNVKSNFSFSLNTSTIMRQNIGLMAEIELAAKTGFNGIEVWMRTVEDFTKKGGKLTDVKKKAADEGIIIENSIGFANWIVDDPNQRLDAMEQLKREMDILNQIGCKRIAAPPFGAHQSGKINLKQAASRFRAVVDLGESMGIKPMLELWGFSVNLNLLGEALFVSAESGASNPLLLVDVYHLFKGGSTLTGLKILEGSCLEVFHMNDYPADFSNDKIADKDRIMPGDGIAPMKEILTILNNKNTPIVLSLELFNEEYWKKDAKETAKIGLEKLKMVVENALN